MVKYEDARGQFGSEDYAQPTKKTQAGADLAREGHLESDVDHSTGSQHHTLGPGPTQASAGTHKHDLSYSALVHAHTFDDLPEIVIPDEIIVSDTQPAPEVLAEGTVWIDSSIPDADIEGLYLVWENDRATITSTTYEHPANWSIPLYTPPIDGFVDIVASVQLDTDNLLNSRTANFKIVLLDDVDAVIAESEPSVSDWVGRHSAHAQFSAPVTMSLTHKITLQFALSNIDGVEFDAFLATARLTFYPSTQHVSQTIATEP